MSEEEEEQRLSGATCASFPILHNRMEFALEVRRQFEEFRPRSRGGGISLHPRRAHPCRHPAGSPFSRWFTTRRRTEPSSTCPWSLRTVRWRPCGWPSEKGLPVHFVDRDTEGYPIDRSPMPDPYALTRIGHYLYLPGLSATPAGVRRRSLEDELREKTMAYHLQRLSETGERILFVCGMFHFPGLLRHAGPAPDRGDRKKAQGRGGARAPSQGLQPRDHDGDALPDRPLRALPEPKDGETRTG